jgi:hypothetical protein
LWSCHDPLEVASELSLVLGWTALLSVVFVVEVSVVVSVTVEAEASAVLDEVVLVARSLDTRAMVPAMPRTPVAAMIALATAAFLRPTVLMLMVFLSLGTTLRTSAMRSLRTTRDFLHRGAGRRRVLCGTK